MRVFHLISAFILIVSHSIFLVRGLYISRKNLKPKWIDWSSRLLSQLSLATTFISGLLLLPIKPIPFFPHVFIGILPVAAIPVIFFGRIILKKRKSLPWLLPVVNLILVALAFITGIVLLHF